jgi:hypothetical protein
MQQATPFFSVIVPTYNQQQWITECIESITSQTFTDFELIVSDDSENDATKLLVQSLPDPRIRYYQNKPSLGRVANYRTCVTERAKGKWIVICDGDDYYTDASFLQKAAGILEQNKELVMLQAGMLKGKNSAEAVALVPQMKHHQLILTGIEYLRQFPQLKSFSHMATISNASVLKQLNPYSFNSISADMETILRLVAHGSVCLLNQPVGLWRQHTENFSRIASLKERVDNLNWIQQVAAYWKQKAVVPVKETKTIFASLQKMKINEVLQEQLMFFAQQEKKSVAGLCLLAFNLFVKMGKAVLLADKKTRIQFKSLLLKTIR